MVVAWKRSLSSVDSGSGSPRSVAIPPYCTALDDQPQDAEAKAAALLPGILPSYWMSILMFLLDDHDTEKTLGHDKL